MLSNILTIMQVINDIEHGAFSGLMLKLESNAMIIKEIVV